MQSLVYYLLQSGRTPLLLFESVCIQRDHVDHVEHVLTRVELGVGFAKKEYHCTVAYYSASVSASFETATHYRRGLCAQSMLDIP